MANDQHRGTWIQTHTSPSPTLSGVNGTLWSIYFLALPGDFQVVKLAWQEPVTSNRLFHTAFGPVLSRLGIFASTARWKKFPLNFPAEEITMEPAVSHRTMKFVRVWDQCWKQKTICTNICISFACTQCAFETGNVHLVCKQWVCKEVLSRDQNVLLKERMLQLSSRWFTSA